MTKLQRELLIEKTKGTAPDVFFTPSHYTPLLMPIPSVISVMDMSFVRFPNYFKKKDYLQLKYWTKASLLQAKKVITISNFSKDEICQVYKIPKEKVTVIHCGFDEERFNGNVSAQKGKIASTLKKYKITQPYLLFLGTLQPRKNLVKLIDAFAKVSNKDLSLVVVGMINEGRGGWMNEPIFEKVKALGLEKRIIFTGYVPNEDVPQLMAGGTAYVLPSLYEGFGIPPVEAMATGTLAIVSKVSSLPEICGEAATYIDDPNSVDSISGAIDTVLSFSPSEREKRVKLGLSWVKRYNWNEAAKATLDVLTKVK